MQIFLYETICGGGLLASGATPAGSLLAEGQAMLSALAEDLDAVPGVQITMLADARLKLPDPPTGCRRISVASATEHGERFDQAAGAADWSIIIAPEIDGALVSWSEQAVAAGGRLLGPSPRFTRLAADKWLTWLALREAGLPTPQTWLAEECHAAAPPSAGPLVIKPRFGAGSQGLRRVEQTEDPWRQAKPGELVQTFHWGTPVSVAVMAGSSGKVILPACRQRLSDDGRFTYLGGELPLTAEADRRARRLVDRALVALPLALGYVGFDLLLGESADGSQDLFIEVNPRMTTSYVGYRALCRDNLAATLLALAEGRKCELSFLPDVVTFGCGGEVSGRASSKAAVPLFAGSA